MSEDEEDWEDYVKGGYHPVRIGDEYSDGRYVVVRKLGWGHFSTVWLARDEKMDRHVALKVVKSAPRYTEAALDEIKFLECLSTCSTPPIAPSNSHSHPGRPHVITLLDHFRHKGPNGIHMCMVFEVLGENLLGLIECYQNKGVPIHLVKQIAKQLLLGLDYMHRCCGIIHADLKPENILIHTDDVESIISSELVASSATARTSPTGAQPLPIPAKSEGRAGEVEDSAMTIDDHQSDNSSEGDLENVSIKVVDLGHATWIEHHFTDDIQTRQYRCLEVILGAKWGPSCDLWSVACILFELITGGDYLFDPASGSSYSKDDDHIAQIIELLGEIPNTIAFSGKYSNEFFNPKRELRHIKKLHYWPLESVLHEKYLFPKVEADALASFLTPMLRFHPDERAKAFELIQHNWLEGIVVQREIDIIQRIEHDETAKAAEAVKHENKEPH